MSDIMRSGIIRMPYDMAMNDEISRIQFYKKAQSVLNELEKLEKLVNSNLDKVGLSQEDFQTATELLACFNRTTGMFQCMGARC